MSALRKRLRLVNQQGDTNDKPTCAGYLFHWNASGELKVRIDRTFPLETASSAQSYMEERGTKGKVLILP